MSFLDVEEIATEAEPTVAAGLNLVWIVVALLCLAILVGFWAVLNALNAIFGGISIFGFHPFTFGLDLVKAGMKKAAAGLESNVGALAEFIWGILITVWRVVFVIVATIVQLSWRDFYANQAQTSNLQSEANQARTTENNLRIQEQTDIARLTQQEAIDVGRLTQQAIDDKGEVLTDISQTISWANAEFSQINAKLNGLTVPDLGGLQTEINNIGTRLAADEQTLTQTVNVTIPRDVSDLTQQIGAGVQAAEGFALGAIATATPGIVAQAVAQLQPQINNIQTEVDDCLEPLCDTVTPNASQLGNLGKLLKDLEGLFAAGALMALLVAAVEDPKGTAAEVTNVMGWVAPLSLDLVNVVGEAAGVVL